MTKKDKLKALNETSRDISRDILGMDRKLEDVDSMTNPAESQKQFNEMKDELNERKIIIEEIVKDIKDLYELRRIINDGGK